MIWHDILHTLLHLDTSLVWLFNEYGAWCYAILFLVVFCETGLVITPFLPGDSLLFTLGTVAAVGIIPVWIPLILLFTAAFSGDQLNFWIGKTIGHTIAVKLIRESYLQKTRDFFERYGRKALIIARFVPIIRTIAPFIAGTSHMIYRHFVGYSIAANVIWVGVLIMAGYWFGQIPFIREHFTIALLIVVIVTLLPVMIDMARAIKQRYRKRRQSSRQNSKVKAK